MDDQTIEIIAKNPVCISLTTEITPLTGSALIGALTSAVNNQHDEIHLLLSTPGGMVADGITAYNAIRALPVPVHTYNIGNVNSIGNVIFQAGDKRIAAITSSFMFHGVGFPIQNAWMELKQLQEKIDTIHNDQALIADILVRRSTLSVENVNKLFLTMAYMNAQEGLQCGLADEVRDIRLPKGMPIQHLFFKG